MVEAENERAVIGDNMPPPATISDRLAVDYSVLIESVEAIAKRANTAPRVVKSDEDLETISKIVKDAIALFKRAEGNREVEKEPHLRASQEVDGWFKVHKDRLTRISTAFQGIADTHAQQVADAERARKAAEAQKLREEEDRKRKAADEAKRQATAEKREAEADDLAERAEVAEALAAAPAEVLLPATTTFSGSTVSAKTEWEASAIEVGEIDFEPLRYLIKRDAIEAAVKQFVKNGGRKLKGAKIAEKVRARIK